MLPSPLNLVIPSLITLVFEIIFIPNSYQVHAYSYSCAIKEYQEALALYHQMHPVPFEGSFDFKEKLSRILDELKAKVPYRYQETIAYPHPNVFSESLYTQIDNAYESLRRGLLYSVGQYVTMDEHGHFHDEAADNYCHMVLRELGVE